METRRIDDVMAEVLAAMPSDLTMPIRLASLVAAAVRASDLPPEVAWCTLARVASDGHDNAPACIKIALPVEGAANERLLVTLHANGAVEQQQATVTGRLDDGAARPH